MVAQEMRLHSPRHGRATGDQQRRTAVHDELGQQQAQLARHGRVGGGQRRVPELLAVRERPEQPAPESGRRKRQGMCPAGQQAQGGGMVPSAQQHESGECRGEHAA